MFSDVEIKLIKKNKLLFSRESRSLQMLIERMNLQNHRTMVMWALNCARITLAEFETKYSDESRPRKCLELCADWAKGKVKMVEAKKAIIGAHAVAKEINDLEYGHLCHAIGHAGATVHTKTHALGLPIYELSAIVVKQGENPYSLPVSRKIDYYFEQLLYWELNTDIQEKVWADFLLK